MDKFVKLAYDSIKYYLENGKYLTEYDEEFKENKNGVIIEIAKGDAFEKSGSIYPTRADIGLDIIYESVNLAIFNNAIALRKDEIDDIYIHVLEVSKTKPIEKMEDFGVYDGLYLNYKNNPIIVFRNDFESDYQMFEQAKFLANIDSFDIYNLYKFKIKRHI